MDGTKFVDESESSNSSVASILACKVVWLLVRNFRRLNPPCRKISLAWVYNSKAFSSELTPEMMSSTYVDRSRHFTTVFNRVKKPLQMVLDDGVE